MVTILEEIARDERQKPDRPLYRDPDAAPDRCRTADSDELYAELEDLIPDRDEGN